jgi:hypothetical protein
MVYHLYILPRRLSLYASKELLYITLATRVAIWYIFKPKIPNWVNFGVSCNGRYWYILWPFGQFSAIWYIVWHFGIFYGTLVYFMALWYTYFPRFGIYHYEKSGSPVGYKKPQRIEAFEMLNFYGFLMTVKTESGESVIHVFCNFISCYVRTVFSI